MKGLGAILFTWGRIVGFLSTRGGSAADMRGMHCFFFVCVGKGSTESP
jgi:hypothetical protein